MDLIKLIGDKTAALPQELVPIIERIISGEVVSVVCIVELQDGSVGDLFELDMNDGHSNRYAVLGALEAAKRDFLRAHIESRIPYIELEEQEDD